MRRARRGRILVILAALLLWTPTARAADLWEIVVTNTDGSGIPVLVVGGSSLPDLLSELVNAQGAFTSFSGAAFSASISFAGIDNVITITVDPSTQTATLTFTVLGAAAQTFTFTGGDLQGQLEQFLEDNIAQQLTAFINKINTLSLIAVTDGSPLSTTARSATYVFERFGLHADLTAWERRQVDGEPFRTGLRGRLDTVYSNITTDVGNGSSVSLVPSLEWVLSPEVSIALLVPINYTEIEGADILNVQASLAVPIRVISPSDESPLGLTLTPFGTLAAAGSVDLVSGGLIGGGGLLGTVNLDFTRVRVSFSSQYSVHEGITMRYEDFEFDPGVSQQIWKNGIKTTLNVGESFYVYGTVTYTQFLKDAAVDTYWTPGAGFGFRSPNGFNLTFGYSGDFDDGYRSDQVRFTVQLPY